MCLVLRIKGSFLFLITCIFSFLKEILKGLRIENIDFLFFIAGSTIISNIPLDIKEKEVEYIIGGEGEYVCYTMLN